MKSPHDIIAEQLAIGCSCMPINVDAQASAIIGALRTAGYEPGLDPLKPLEFAIGRFELNPDDILVVKSHLPLSDKAAMRIQEIVRQAVGHDKCLLVEGHIELSVLTKGAAA